MKECILTILDEVNVKFDGLDPDTRRRLVQQLSYMNPKARHMPTFKMGRWDGKVPFATIGGRTFLNLLPIALEFIIGCGYEVDIKDQRNIQEFNFDKVTENIFSSYVWPSGHPLSGQSIVLNDHQVRAANDFLTPNEFGNYHSMQSIATGAGKTVLTAALAKTVESYGRTFTVVPSKDLVTQTEEDFVNLNLNCGVYYGDRKDYNAHHTISTWQSLTRLYESDVVKFNELTNGMISLVIDEAHTLTGKKLKELCTGPLSNVPIRIGMTGTIPKEPHEYNALLVSIGPTSGEITAKELQDKGILSNCNINVLQTVDDVEYQTWDGEIGYLCSDKKRLDWLENKIRDIAKSGNTLVLCTKIDLGKELSARLNVPFMYGNVKSKDRKKEYKSINTAENEILLATFGVAAVGISINRLFNLVIIEAGKSFTRSIQSVGRGLRIAEDKDHVEIYDICSTAKFSKRHLAKRKEYYKEAEYPFKITKVKYR